MKKQIIIFLNVAFLVASCSGDKKNEDPGSLKLANADREEIMTTFMATQDAWNEGDLDGFMKGYWESDSLVFTGVSGPTYGYMKTLERYRLSYPDQEKMGILKFRVVDLYRIDRKTALMIGQFYLSRSMGDVVGYFTLVWQKTDKGWRIISDHSSGQIIQE